MCQQNKDRRRRNQSYDLVPSTLHWGALCWSSVIPITTLEVAAIFAIFYRWENRFERLDLNSGLAA